VGKVWISPTDCKRWWGKMKLTKMGKNHAIDAEQMGMFIWISPKNVANMWGKNSKSSD
jgi:hypothetical protein